MACPPGSLSFFPVPRDLVGAAHDTDFGTVSRVCSGNFKAFAPLPLYVAAMDAVFASVVSSDILERVLERFQAAEQALREGGPAASAEATEMWNRVGSATSAQALNPFFVAVLLGWEPPLGPARGASVPRDVPSGGVKAEPNCDGCWG